jgi:hypothetical protein
VWLTGLLLESPDLSVNPPLALATDHRLPRRKLIEISLRKLMLLLDARLPIRYHVSSLADHLLVYHPASPTSWGNMVRICAAAGIGRPRSHLLDAHASDIMNHPNSDTREAQTMSSKIDAVVPREADVFGGTTAHTPVFKTLASRSCRYVIYYFLAASDTTVSVADLVTGVQTLAGSQSKHSAMTDGRQLESLLSEETLPQLERLGVVDYDARSATVRYYQQPFVEEYAEHAAHQELSSDFVHDSL